jgi:hypothetical protein
MPYPRLDNDSPTVRFQMMMTEAWLARVDAWRKKNRMTRARAIRLLVDQALDVKPSAAASLLTRSRQR